jgi:signal transduction histidine kinase/CheY-like chemotaxis protein
MNVAFDKLLEQVISLRLDYVLFVLLSISTVAWIAVWLRRKDNYDRSFRFAWIVLAVVLLAGLIGVEAAEFLARKSMRNSIISFAPTYARELEQMGHADITTDTPPDDVRYLRMIRAQKRWLKVSHNVADIYTFRQSPDGNSLIVDSETDYNRDGRFKGERESRTDIGEIWHRDSEAVRRAYQGHRSFDDGLYTDRWGIWVSAFAPMYDEEGNFEAVLGVDFPANAWVHGIAMWRFAALTLFALLASGPFAAMSVISVLRANAVKLKEQNRQLELERQRSEEATRAKSSFLASMSHEIRTPLNGIIGVTDLVLDTKLTRAQRDYLSLVRESGESLICVINDILDFSKIEADKLDLEHEPFDLVESLGDVLRSMVFRAHSKGLELALWVSPSVHSSVIGDRSRLRQVVVNLVGNAIKFTEKGEVVVSVHTESRTADDVVIQISVRDTGIGIPVDNFEKIFEDFKQVDQSTTRRFGGTGLGLAISRKLVQLMGGRIWVESTLGEGSTFHFTTRLRRGPEVPLNVAHLSTQIADKRVLVVDDNATSRQILSELFGQWGMQCVSVASKTEAMEQLTAAFGKNEPYHLVVSDVNMPVKDGFDLVQAMRDDSRIASTKVILLTSGETPRDMERCETLGVVSRLMKPIKQSEVFEAVVRALGHLPEKPDSSSTQPAIAPVARPLRILLAEDSLVNQKLAIGLLEKAGHQVVVANDGQQAVQHFSSERFDLILMDVQMPTMDGMEATAEIRKRESRTGTRIPIVAMTAHAMKGDRERFLDSGMDAYLAKPIRAADLHATIAKLTSPSDGVVGGDLSIKQSHKALT